MRKHPLGKLSVKRLQNYVREMLKPVYVPLYLRRDEELE